MKLACWAVVATLGVVAVAGSASGEDGTELPSGIVRFRAFGSAEGLHNLFVVGIAQDARGFLWVGTEDGVARYDGERFTRFGVDQGLVSTAIGVVGTAPDGNVCVGSNIGLVCWDGARFSRTGARGLPEVAVLAIATAQGRLWVGCADGLYVRGESGSFARAEGWPGAGPIRAVWADEQGVVAADQDRVLISAGNGVWRDLSAAGITGDRIQGVLRDRAGGLWIRASQHMWRLPRDAARAEDVSEGFPPALDVGATGTMVNGPRGEVWFACDGGIAYRDGDHWRMFGRSSGLPFPGARTLFVDREGSTWVGATGLFQWRGRGLIEHYAPGNGLPGDTAWSFARDRNGVLWAGTDLCLARMRRGSWECMPGTEKRMVRSFVFPPQGGVFVGGAPADLLYLDPSGKPVSLGRDLADLTDRAILALRIGPEGDLWIATRSGLFRMPGAVPGALERVAIPGIPSDDCYSSLLVADGRLWVASTHGLAVHDGGRWRVLGTADGLRSASTRYVVATHDHGYCVAYTEAIGLTCFEMNGAAVTGPRHIGVAEGLSGGAVYFLGEDRSHHLWVGTGDGVDVLTPRGAEHFGESEGIAGNDSAATAFFEDTDGSLWFGASGGASHFHAERYDGPPPPPRALLRDGKLGQQVIGEHDPAGLSTPYDHNALKVELGSDRLADAARVEYQVRLLPLEPEWSATLARQARYPALLPGVYQFEVRARLGASPWGPTTALPFVVRPAWWQTRWFLALGGLAILVAIGLGFTWRQRAVLQRRTRQLNEESAASVRAVLEHVPDLVSVHRDGKVIYANLAARRIYGIEAGGQARGERRGQAADQAGDQIEGQDQEGQTKGQIDGQIEGEIDGLGDRIHPDDRARVTGVLQAPHGTDARRVPEVVELRVRDEDGGWRICEVSGVWVELAGATVLVASGRDVTERHRLRAQLLVSDRMASLGTLAAGIAHEINNPLSYVIGNLQMMAESVASGSEGRDELVSAIGDATDGAQRVRKIVHGLRSFSRAEEESRVRLEIPEVLRAAIRLTANEVRHRAQLVCELGDTPKVVADDGRLTQVFINLIVNAAHAIPEGHSDANTITVRTRGDGAGHAVIEIEDTGRGMPPDVQARAFDPFFTTKEIGGGTGLGLSICHGIVSALGGRIAIESTVGRGTLVRVALPPAEPLEVAPAQPASPVIPTSSERLRILVVDDEPLVIDMLARVLRRDHEVVAVSCGRAALDEISRGGWFDAIVSDVMMPNMTGLELLEALVELDPAQAKRLIFLSGGVFTPETRARLDKLGTLQLEKPVGMKDLRRAVMGVAATGSGAAAHASPAAPASMTG